MFKLMIKFIIGVLAIPVAYAVTKAFYANFILIKEVAVGLQYFTWGIVGYMVLHLLFYKPTYLYVLGHEAVHAGAAWIFGGKIKSFKVSKEGGQVATTKSNFIIELAPYFLPMYTIIVTVIYFVVSRSYPVNSAIFLFLIGFTLALHIVATVEIVKVKQPDIVKSGYVFSIVIIYIVNIIVVSLLFGLTFTGFSINKFFLDLWDNTKYIYLVLIRQLFF